MKRSKQCPKCGSLRVGRIEHVVTVDEGADGQVQLRPIPVGRFAGRGGDTNVPIGPLEAFLCADCGYYELYLREPRSVPYENIPGFTWLNSLGPSAPYR